MPGSRVNLQELLSSEIDVADLARRGWYWWVDELASMLPPSWRARLSSRPSLWAEQIPGGVWRYWKDDCLVAPPPVRPGAPTVVGLLLPPGAVLVREVPAPRMPPPDLRRMLALDIDRLSPLAPSLIHFDFEVIDRDDGDGRQRVRVGITPRSTAAELVEAARAEGLTPAALGVRSDGDAPDAHFDFLPAVLEAAAETPRRWDRYWWGGVVAMLALNLAVLVGRDMADVAALHGMVDAQTPLVNAALGLRRRVEAEESRRAQLVAQGQRAEPLRMLDALTLATPPGAWVQHLEWNGQALRIVGYKRPDVDLAAALRGSGAFTNIRVQAPEAGPGSVETPFDIAAEARFGGRP